MTKLRGYIPTMLMVVTLMFGATAANAGIVIGGRAEATTTTAACQETTLTGILSDLASFVRTGIVMGGRDGIVIGGREGIVIGGRTECTTTATFGIVIGG